MKLFLGDSGYYFVRYRASGRSRVKSLKTQDKAEAERLVLESHIAELEAAGSAQLLSNQVMSTILSGKKISMLESVAEFSRSLLNNAASRRTIANYEHILRRWITHQRIAGHYPNMVEPFQVASFINDPMFKSGAATRNLNLTAIRSMFEFLMNRGWAIKNPAKEVRVDYSILSHTQKEARAKRPFEESEYRKVLEDCQCRYDCFWEYAVRLGWETGLRLIDVCCLEWDSLRIPLHVTVWTEKTNQRVQLPVSEALINLVDQHGDHSGRFVWPHQRAMIIDPGARTKLNTAFARILKRLKIYGVSFHSFRRSKAQTEYDLTDRQALAEKLAEHLTVKQIGAALGHSSTATTEVYLNRK